MKIKSYLNLLWQPKTVCRGLYTIVHLICDLRTPNQDTKRRNTEAYRISRDKVVPYSILWPVDCFTEFNSINKCTIWTFSYTDINCVYLFIAIMKHSSEFKLTNIMQTNTHYLKLRPHQACIYFLCLFQT